VGGFGDEEGTAARSPKGDRDAFLALGPPPAVTPADDGVRTARNMLTQRVDDAGADGDDHVDSLVQSVRHPLVLHARPVHRRRWPGSGSWSDQRYDENQSRATLLCQRRRDAQGGLCSGRSGGDDVQHIRLGDRMNGIDVHDHDLPEGRRLLPVNCTRP